MSEQGRDAGGGNRGRLKPAGGGGVVPSWMKTPKGGAPFNLPPLEVMTTTLWSYPSQHYWSERQRKMVGVAGARYTGATPSWVVWQVLTRYTRAGETVVDPMVGSGTTLDVCEDLGRRGVGFDVNPQRPTITLNDARSLPLKDSSVDLFFVDPPYSTHVKYSDHPACIGRLDSGGTDGGAAYYQAMRSVLREGARVLRPGRHMAVYVSDSFVKREAGSGTGTTSAGDRGSTGEFMPIGMRLMEMMCSPWTQGGAGLRGVDIIAVVRGNQKLSRGNWHAAAEEGNFFLRGFNYLLLAQKPGR